MAKVKILNPIDGRYTSINRANQYIRQGVAVMTSQGYLEFLSETQQRREAERNFLMNRGGILFWNGSGPRNAMSRPGERRS